jgi:aspartyl-tRNA(Asn)/glutamyl-tRNA(Gln) amidotransferase subunit C
MSIDKDTVRKIAHLARLDLHESDLEPMALELTNIMHFIEKLSEVNTDTVHPLLSVAHCELPLREDRVTEGNTVDKILANAPDSFDNFFLVPKVVE